MPFAAVSLALPDLVAIGLVVGIPALLLAVFWRHLAPARTGNLRLSLGHAPAIPPGSARLGLPGQWAIHERKIAAGIDRQSVVLELHRQIALQIGALDYEIDQLWRETKALAATAPSSRANISTFTLPTHTRRPSAPAYEAYRQAAAASVLPQAMAS
jgi:hypothetical protein